jgi:transposase
MDRKFRDWQPEATWLFPPSPRDWLPEDHLVYFLLDVTAQVDISPIVNDYASEQGGQPPYHPRMMLVLLLYAYSVGVFSSRKIMQRCETDAAFRVIVVEDIPNFRRIAEFRARHLEHLQPLFLEVLILCRAAGLLKVGRISLDGTKVKANASRNKAMSYDRMGPEVERLQGEIDALIAQAKGADSAEDDQFGDLSGDEIPDELKRRERRLEKISEAKEALEAEARQKAQDHVDKMEAEGRNHRTNPDEAVPKPKDQCNFTDPESKIMKTSNKGFDQCGNAQAVANEQQIIIAADVTNQANDVRQVEPMVAQTIDNLEAADVNENIESFTADAGYFSEENMETLDSNDRIDAAFVATGRQKHSDPTPDSPKGRPPADMTPKQKMARRNRTKKGQAEYARRKVIIEPVFGQIKAAMGFRNFSLRGLEKMQGEWNLVCIVHNLGKLFRSGAMALS